LLTDPIMAGSIIFLVLLSSIKFRVKRVKIFTLMRSLVEIAISGYSIDSVMPKR
jgi:hypothetical protein